MEVSYRYIRLRLSEAGILPRSRMARVAWYLLGIDIALFALQKLLGLFHVSYGRSLGGWVSILSFVVIVLFAFLAFRWLRSKLLWRLRNRLIVTYVFIGVIPVVLILAMFGISGYLLGNQLTTMLVHRDLMAEVQSLDTMNATVSLEIASRVTNKPSSPLRLSTLAPGGPTQHFPQWTIAAWLNGRQINIANATSPGADLGDR